MNCISCKSENLADRRYCGQCGRALSVFCSFCGFGNSIVDKFCGGCGRGTQEQIPVQEVFSHSPTSQNSGPPKPSEPKNISKTMLDELLGAKQELQKQEKNRSETKKSVSQEDIDRLLEGGS